MKSLLDTVRFRRSSAGPETRSAPKIVEAVRFPYGPFKFKILLPEATEYDVEVTTNRESWKTIFSGTCKGLEQAEFVDSDAANFSYRLYRAEANGITSENIVGYVTTTLPPGFSIVANPLHSPDSTVPSLFSNMPDGTQVSRFDSRTYSLVESTLSKGRWTNPSQTLAPGEAAIVFIPGSEYKNLSFVGELLGGTTSTPIPAGFTLRGSSIPKPGRLDTDLGFPVSEGDVIHLYDRDKQKYALYPFENGAWKGPAPVLGIAEGFWVAKKEGRNWIIENNTERSAVAVGG